METYEDFRTNPGEATILHKWLLRAFVASVLLHLGLFVVFKTTRLERFSQEAPERLVPRAFTVARAEIDPKVFAEEKQEPAPASGAKDIQKPSIDLPAELPSAEQMPREIRATPNPAELATPITTDSQRPTAASFATLQRMRDEAERVTQETAAFQDLLKDPTDLSSTALTSLSTAAAKSTGPSTGDIGSSGPGGYSNIDKLLGQTGPLGDGTKPLYMPAAPLFTYDSADLQAGGISALAKLGLLIKKHPEASYVIEGYSDSIGDAAYNLDLSRRRAEAVRTWLVSRMGVNPAQVQTKGLGAVKFIAKPTGDIDAEAPNRRVEIVIRTPEPR